MRLIDADVLKTVLHIDPSSSEYYDEMLDAVEDIIDNQPTVSLYAVLKQRKNSR